MSEWIKDFIKKHSCDNDYDKLFQTIVSMEYAILAGLSVDVKIIYVLGFIKGVITDELANKRIPQFAAKEFLSYSVDAAERYKEKYK